MTPTLADLAACFEGVIPSIIATTAADGTPNISYLSHVARVDEGHVALSNQFFSKTAANLRANPRAALLVVDALSGLQFQLDVTYLDTVTEGPLFDRMAADLRATSDQLGMATVMRLRGVDIHRVDAIRAVRSAVMRAPAPPAADRLPALADLAAGIATATDLGRLVDGTLAALQRNFGFGHAMILLAQGDRLVTIASTGYDRSGIGAEVALGDGLIGMAGLARRTLRISDMSRARRFAAAVAATSLEENLRREIALPGLDGAMSQLAVPIVAQARLRGVLMLESVARLAFTPADELAMTIVAGQLGAALGAFDGEMPETAELPAEGTGPSFAVVHHSFDDSVFIGGDYIVKGVAGRLLIAFLRAYVADGRQQFSNREIRLDTSLRLPEFKDNLETRLLLLQRRLDEKAAPVRLERPRRGRIRLSVTGRPVVSEGEAHLR